MAIEWEETAATPAATADYQLAYNRVSNAAGASYAYQTLFNPSASGKTALVKRLNIDVDCSAVATYANNIYIRRITAATAGTQIAAANIPKLHTSAANSIMEARYGGTTAISGVTLAGTASSVIEQVTPCGAANEPNGHAEATYGDSGVEPLVLQPGEGIALLSSTTGSTGQLVRLSAQWTEQAAVPTSQSDYSVSIGPVAGNTTVAAYAYASFFNPAASGKTAVIHRVYVAADAAGAAASVALTMQRTTAATTGTGTTIAVADIPKNHSASGSSAMQIQSTGPTVTKSGTAAARMATVDTPSAVGQLNGRYKRDFGADQQLVLQPGQGIALSQEALGNANFRIKISFEWTEQATVPTNTGEYIFNAGPVAGSTVSGYTYAAFLNPTGSGKNVVVHRLAINQNATGTNAYVPMSVQRISAIPSGGTAITNTDIPVKHTATASSIMTIRTTGPTTTAVGSAAARLYSLTTPGAVGSGVAPQVSGNEEFDFDNSEALVLLPGEGIRVYQEAAATGNMKIRVQMEWEEAATTPASQGEYAMAIGPVAGSLVSGYTYASMYNPSTSGKNYIVKRIEIRSDRIGAATAPNYIPASVRRITAASGGTAVATADIPEKNTNTAASTAEVRTTGITTTPATVNDGRLSGVTVPGGVGQDSGLNEANIIYGDELVLAPGEGIALTQEAAAGDANVRFTLRLVWSEQTQQKPTLDQSNYRWYNNTDAVQPTTAVAAENTPGTIANTTTSARLRMGLTNTVYPLMQGKPGYRLQHATATGGPWTNVSSMSTLMTDNFTGTDGSAWNAANWVESTTASGASSAILSNEGQLKSGPQATYGGIVSRRANITNLSNAEIVSTFHFDSTQSTLRFYLRGNSLLNSDSGYYFEPAKNGTTQTIGVSNAVAGDAAVGTYTSSFTVTANTLYKVRFRAYGTSLSVKMWPAANAEPANWDLTSTQGLTTTAGASGVYLMGDASGTIGSASVDDFSITSLDLASTEWYYANNPNTADGATVTSGLLTGTTALESYAESAPTASVPNTLTTGTKGEWDFVLSTASAIANTTYYFRMVAADGTPLSTYTVYPQLTLTGNAAPNVPTSLTQKLTSGTTLATGGWTNTSSLKFSGTLSDPDSSDVLYICVEKALQGASFTGTDEACSSVSAANGAIGEATLSSIPSGNKYNWRARTRDNGGLYSTWVQYGGNTEVAPDFDFGIDTTPPTGGTVYDGASAGTDVSFNDGSLTTLSAKDRKSVV